MVPILTLLSNSSNSDLGQVPPVPSLCLGLLILKMGIAVVSTAQSFCELIQVKCLEQF